MNTAETIRALVAKRLKELGLTAKQVSLDIGQSHSYMQQFLERGVPRFLPERVRGKVATMLQLEEADLRGESSPHPVGQSNPHAHYAITASTEGAFREHVPIVERPSMLESHCAHDYVAKALIKYPQATRKIIATVEKQIAEMLMRDNRSNSIFKSETYVGVAEIILMELCGRQDLLVNEKKE